MSLMLTGKTMLDYFNINCEKCGSLVKLTYRGWDPAVPHFDAHCEKCNARTTLKLSAQWRGLPAKATT